MSYNGNEKFYGATRWLTYLVEHFLRPGAYAQDSGLECFREFTFDHHVEGIVVGCRRDNKELFAIKVDDGAVREEILRPADKRYLDYEPLPYEKVIDRQESARSSRSSKLRSS